MFFILLFVVCRPSILFCANVFCVIVTKLGEDAACNSIYRNRTPGELLVKVKRVRKVFFKYPFCGKGF